MYEFQFKGHRIHYTDTAPGSTIPAVVFIHGSMSSSRIFANQIIHFQARYRCITLDLLGHGKSSAPPPSQVTEDFYSLSGLANSIMALLSHLSIDRASFVGWSLGSTLCLTIALSYPKSVKNLVLIAASPVFFLKSDDDNFPAIPPSRVDDFLNSIRNDYSSFYKKFVYQQYPEASQESHPTYIEEALDDAASRSPEVMYTIIKNSGRTDFREILSEIKTKTLIINGMNDPFCLFSAARWMHERFGGPSRCILYEGGGHVPFVGPESEMFSRDVVAFLDEL